MAKLIDAIAAGNDEAGVLMISAPAAWSQGRTLYGGMTAALCHEAALRTGAATAPLRSAQYLFVGPATGALRFSAEVLRQGRSSTAIAVDGRSDEGPVVRASLSFGAGRESAIRHRGRDLAALPPAPEDCPLFVEWRGGFHDNFELRLAAGSALFSQGVPDFTVWVRFRDSQEGNATTALLALADALPPAAMACLEGPAPISTVSWTVDIADVPEAVAGWYLLRSASEDTRDGHSLQAMDLWDARGRHVASGRQLVAIFA